MAKGNKEMLATVNFSMDVVKRIKAGDVFTKEEKQETLNGYIGLDDKNNSYWTPVAITNWVKQLLNIQGNVRIADFSAGIGNFAVPFIKEYGKLDDDIQFDLYELDSNTSLALKEAWSDYDQVNVYSDFNSLDRHEEIPNDYDIVLGNPPFSSSTKYYAEWNHNKKCDESFYNCTLGFSQYDAGPFGEVYVGYDFICSKSYRIKNLVERLIKENKYLSNIT